MQFLPWSVSPNGVITEIGFLREPGKRRQIVTRQIIPAKTLNDIMDQNAAARNGRTIAKAVRGHTQHHRVPIARIPEEYYWFLRRQLGNPHTCEVAAKRWKRWLNNSDNAAFRMVEGVL